MGFKILMVIFTSITINKICPTIYDPTQDHMYTYGTTDDFGPSNWDSTTCKGSKQNPFIVSAFGSNVNSGELPKLDLFGGVDVRPKEIKVINNGFGVFFKFNYHYLNAPKIYGGPLKSDLYQFDSFSYHIRSEHTVFADLTSSILPQIEFDFLHFNLKYETLEKARKEHDGLAVIAVRYGSFGSGNLGTPFPIPLISLIGSVYHPFTEVSLTGSNLFTYADALGFNKMPAHLSLHGSLTTPPCHESVQWFLLSIERPFDINDLDKFKN